MYKIFEELRIIAETSFGNIIDKTKYIFGKTRAPNKLRIFIIDGTFVDIWLSPDGDYSYHWEQRAKRGLGVSSSH